MPLEIIGAGFGRTGTTSLKAALEQIGFGPCHHMDEVVGSPAQIDHWQRIADGEPPDWDTVFADFRSACDWPSCTHWEALAAHFPDAKIVLTVRDEARWYDSVAETIYPASYLLPAWLQRCIPQLDRANRMIVAKVWQGEFGGRFEDRDHALSVYREHVAAVRERADPERLLVFEVKDGWSPLCAFLGVPEPETPFPHLNDARQIRRVIAIARALGWLALAGAGIAALALLYWLLG